MKKKTLTPAKAKEMLRDGTANGQKLTKAQKGYFGAVAGGDSTGPRKPKNAK